MNAARAKLVSGAAVLITALVLGEEPAPMLLHIERGSGFQEVQVTFNASEGLGYQLFESLDLVTWTLRQTKAGSGGVVSVPVELGPSDRTFFRLKRIPLQPLPQMVWIPPGHFLMGSPPDEVGRFLDKEEPQTHVSLTHGFWMSRYEVTQGEFQAVMGFNPSLFKDDAQRPVENVTWFQAIAYCETVTKRQREEGHLTESFEYRLPTESEWEYAARAGTTTRFSYGDDPGYVQLRDYAWYNGDAGLRSHPIGQKRPNPWGLYDMHGNVFEWCLDWFAQLPGGSVTDPPGAENGTDRNIRGGYWDSTPEFCRCALRVHFPPATRISYLGFRMVLAETNAR
jgi:formylglycine-generating enzyme required for sulfatase activity